MDSLARQLILLVPPVRRARGFRIYLRDGRRLLDLWQEGGAGILGAHPAGLINAVKSDLEAGRYQGLPSDALSRCARKLVGLFPGYAGVECFASPAEARAALAGPGAPASAEWRPFLPVPEAEALMVLPPLPAHLRPAFVLLKKGAGLDPRGAALPAALQARAALRALEVLRREECSTARAETWARFDAANPGTFLRQGPYLSPSAGIDYPALFKACLARGALISPDPALPSIVPGEFSPGELAFLKEPLP